jgi:hypothetical protein
MVKSLTTIILAGTLATFLMVSFAYILDQQLKVSDGNYDAEELERYNLITESDLNEKLTRNYDELYEQPAQTTGIDVPFVQGIWSGVKSFGSYTYGLTRQVGMLAQDLHIPGFVVAMISTVLVLVIIVNWKRMFGGQVP